MGFSSLDDLISEITAGKYLRRECAKVCTPAAVAANWTLLAGYNGYPVRTTFPGTELMWQTCDDYTGDGTNLFGIQHGGDVASDTKHIINVGSMIVAAAGAPWQVKLVDLQGYYLITGANVTGTGSRTLINSNAVTFDDGTGFLRVIYATNDFKSGTKVRFSNSGGALPTGVSADTDYWITRIDATHGKLSTTYALYKAGTFVAYTNTGTPTTTMIIQMPRYANGIGCQAFFVTKTAPTAGGPNLTASAYDNTTVYTGAGTSAFAGAPNMMATPVAGAIPHSGAAAAGRYGAFLPLAASDLGVGRINSFTWSTGTAYTGSGAMALCIARPLLDLALPVTGMFSERDLVNQLCSLPKVEDGACLQWLVFSTGATTNNTPFTATIDFAWG